MALSCAERIVTVPARLVHYHTGRNGSIPSKKDRAPLDAYNVFLAARSDLLQRGLLDPNEDWRLFPWRQDYPVSPTIDLRQHRTMGTAGFGGSFAEAPCPIMRCCLKMEVQY